MFTLIRGSFRRHGGELRSGYLRVLSLHLRYRILQERMISHICSIVKKIDHVLKGRHNATLAFEVL